MSNTALILRRVPLNRTDSPCRDFQICSDHKQLQNLLRAMVSGLSFSTKIIKGEKVVDYAKFTAFKLANPPFNL